MSTGRLIFPVLWSLLSCYRKHNKVHVKVPVGTSPQSHSTCAKDAGLDVAGSFSACPPFDAETHYSAAQKEIFHGRIKIMFESEIKLQFSTLFCSAAPVLRYKLLCKLYIVVCFVQHSIVHSNMCVYIYISLFLLLLKYLVLSVTVQSSVKLSNR